MTTQTAVTNKIFTEFLHWFTTPKKFLGKFFYKVFRQNKLKKFTGSGIEYWEQRHKKFGARSVLNLGHPEEKFETITRIQKDFLFPLLQKQLKGNEKTILDFGCGPGRFTIDLAKIIQGRAIGVEPSQTLRGLAPTHKSIEYLGMEEGIIHVDTASVDVVWICQVLSIILDKDILQNTIKEIDRVLKKDGLFFLVENISAIKDKEYIHFRSIKTYQKLFNFVDLNYLSEYEDLGERIAIMAGRKVA